MLILPKIQTTISNLPCKVQYFVAYIDIQVDAKQVPDVIDDPELQSEKHGVEPAILITEVLHHTDICISTAEAEIIHALQI